MTASHSAHTLSRTKRLGITAMIVLSTVLFVGGVVAERGSGSNSAPAPRSQSAAATAPPEGSEAREAQERQEAPAAATAPQGGGEGTVAHEITEQNRVFGVDVEAPGFIAGVVIGTLLLIAALFLFGPRVLPLVLLVTITAAIFDGREVIYQLGQAHYGIAVLALGVVVSRLAAAVLHGLRCVRHSIMHTRRYDHRVRRSLERRIQC